MVAGFGALLILALLFAAVFGNAIRAGSQRREAQGWYIHTLEVLRTVESIKSAANSGMRGERGYLITHDESFLQPYLDGRRDSPQLVAKLEQLTRDNPRQRVNVAALKARNARLFRVLDMAVALTRKGQEPVVVAMIKRGIGRHEIDMLFHDLVVIEAEENRLLAIRAASADAADDAIARNNLELIGVGLLLLVIAGAAGASTMRAQSKIRETAERLRLSATTDELTGLANRRAFMHSLEIEVARAERSGSPLSVAVVDLDHFKKVNDRFGHAGGDSVLKGFADVARRTMRTGDVVGRLGGEEFGVLMPDTDVAKAKLACERLRAEVAAARFTATDGTPIRVTVSTGIALLVAGEERDHLVTRADDALYRAKEAGRNQVQTAA
jgi:diguanylate cyclase (GGDEF)-like protein